MNKIYLKLIAISLTLILSVSVVVVSTYAWLVMSGNPAVSGIQVTIGGGNTILVAPDMTEEVDGVIYHYPGPFTDNMNFSRYTTYTYLKDLEGLTPVSTADGVHWFLPQYYDYSDPEVAQGKILSGTLKDYSDFYLDGELEYANIPAGDKELSEKGSYIYLDFWVVSPGDNYTLRLSTGTDTGSFVVDLMEPTEADTVSGYALTESEHQGSSAMRVGFLVNPVRLTDDTMLLYQNSSFFDKRYTSLQGLYQEPGIDNPNFESNRFTIYEPNADVHPSGAAQTGEYVRTMPLAWSDGEIHPVSVFDRVTVQRASYWMPAQNGFSSEIEQRFQAAMMTEEKGRQPEEISAYFYEQYLQWQIAPYVVKGKFLEKSASLASYGSGLTAAEFSALNSAGATDDVYIIKLERNVPQRIRMFIWLEGQDVDCVNAVATSNFLVNLELAGANDELE